LVGWLAVDAWLHPDGNPTDHAIGEEDARRYVDSYNRAVSETRAPSSEAGVAPSRAKPKGLAAAVGPVTLELRGLGLAGTF
jgi:hypothetical protein